MNPQEAAQKLFQGELVVFPTETVYGLGALASDDRAVLRIFQAKGRPPQNPLILHIADNEQLKDLTSEIPASAQKLIDHFWPGPLTICFKKSEKVSTLISAGLSTVCVRRPDHAIAREFLKSVGQAVAAPSANISGKPSTTTYEDARRQLEEKGVLFLDGGTTPLGIESTIIDCSEDTLKLLRPGSVSRDQIEDVLGGKIMVESEASSAFVTSPGQLLEHYAPSGELVVLFGAKAQRDDWIQQHIEDPSEWHLGTFSEISRHSFLDTFFLAEKERDLTSYAAKIYAFLNWSDLKNAKKILLELPNSTDPIVPTLLNRLQKASRGHILRL